MPIRSGFFNSVNGDRRYQADFFAMFFGTLIGNGVFPNPSTGLQVLANQNMTVAIKPGKGWINGYFFVNDSDYNLTIENADGVLNRIDRVVLQLNFLNREIVPVVKKGTFASSPVAPTLKRDADAYEIALADIYVGKGVLSISQANITDVRLNKDLCGIVKGLIDQVDTTTIFNQYQAWFANITGSTQTEIDTWKTQQEQDFDTWEEGRKSEFQTWFDSIQSILDGDVAANLASIISNLENDVARHKADEAAHGIGNKATLLTTNKSTIVGAINEVFQSGNNVKRDMVDALLALDPSLPISYSSTWREIELAVGQISTGIKSASGSFTAASNLTTRTITGLAFTPSTVILRNKVGNGSPSEHVYTNIGDERHTRILKVWDIDESLFDNYNQGQTILLGIKLTAPIITPTTDGFRISVSYSVLNSGNYEWIAFE